MGAANGPWYSFATVTGWSSHQKPPAVGHRRALSSIIMRSSPPKPSAVRSATTAEVPRMPDMDAALDENDLGRAMGPEHDMSEGLGPGSPHHPDLDDEVATLSTKLVNAINHQTSLDDNLSVTRLELDQAQAKIRKLEERIASQQEMLSGDVWVRRKTVEADRTSLLHRVADEKRAKQAAEEQSRKMEHELEALTAALFEEANKMVKTAKEEARAEQEALHRKNDQLRAQLADTEGLLKSQHDQLVELKHVMEQMSSERDDQTCTTTPSSPGPSKRDSVDSRLQSSALEPLSPSYPTSFTYLLQPVLRTDLTAFNEFRDLLRTSKRLSGQSMTGARGSVGASTSASASAPWSASASASPAIGSPQVPNASASASASASAPASTSTSTASAGSGVPAVLFPSLRDTKFYKRALMEDVEPTLRLDMAPGLSWLARRTVVSAMTDGSLVVEPVPSPSPGGKSVKAQAPAHPCSLCGECRPDEDHLRTHRFRTSETSSQRYLLCKYCLNRLRSTCDFLGFLRIVKDGHWRADDDDAEKAAWEESVRLREQMFWARMGGGVLPAGAGHHPDPAADYPVPQHVDADADADDADAADVTMKALELNEPAFSGNSHVGAETGLAIDVPTVGETT